jgi:hypothetical protein
VRHTFMPDHNGSLFDLEALKQKGGLTAGDILAVDSRLYEKFMIYNSRRVKRDKATCNLIFLTGLSAYTSGPINTFLRGESSLGKTYITVNVLKPFPSDDVWFLGSLSPTALVHDKGSLVDKHGDPIIIVAKPEKEATQEEKDAYFQFLEKLRDSHYVVDLSGRILVFLEAPNIKTFNMLRPILSHDVKEISYKFTDKTAKGRLQTQHVVIRGWPATVFCSTSEEFVNDLATRSFTFTPENTEAKIKDANILSGSKAAFPWKFEENQDFMLLQGYIKTFKDKMKEIKSIIPYADKFAEQFPSKFPRAMRDFTHLLALIEVKTLFHYAQRPILVRTIKHELAVSEPDSPRYSEETQTYVLATRGDYDSVIDLWNQIRETTETSAAVQIITFFHEVVEKLAERKTGENKDGLFDVVFTIKELADFWNNKFPSKKSSDTIRKWVDFLCQINFMTKEPGIADRRENLLRVIKNKSGNYTQNDFTALFTFESFKAWLNEARQITASNQIFLRKDILNSQEATPEEVYSQYYLSDSSKNAVICPDDCKASIAKRVKEKAESKEIVQFLHLKETDSATVATVETTEKDHALAHGAAKVLNGES